MLALLSSVLSAIVNTIHHVLQIISAIPYYCSLVLRWINLSIPSTMLPFIILGLTIAIFIHIKRLVF